MSVLFLGPLPPPVHGFSAINAAMLAHLQQMGPVTVFNRAVPASASSSVAGRSVRALGHWLGLLGGFIGAASRRPTSCYAGLSGGKGQLLDLPFFAVARVFGMTTYVHHHSFAYLNRRSRLTHWCMKLLGNAQHIALCPEMAKAIHATYGIPQGQLTVLSNAAFLPALEGKLHDHSGAKGTTAIRIGFLSNITAEKGIFEFFSALRRATEMGIAYEAEIAGPVDAAIREQFDAELAALPHARHVGPLYGGDKQRFFQRTDLLLFPTRYQNEAEPVTLHEALQAGATVVAASRGCIGGMLPDHCGAARPAEQFEAQALETLKELDQLDQAQRSARRQAIQAHYQRTAADSQQTLQQLLKRISHPPRPAP
jgi:glycosyltransferase involved in cell wall biosynthesis